MKNKNLVQEDDIGFRAIGRDGFYLSSTLRRYTFLFILQKIIEKRFRKIFYSSPYSPIFAMAIPFLAALLEVAKSLLYLNLHFDTNTLFTFFFIMISLHYFTHGAALS